MDNDEVVQDLGIGGGKGRRHIASCIGETDYNSDGDDDGDDGDEDDDDDDDDGDILAMVMACRRIKGACARVVTRVVIIMLIMMP